MISFDDFQQIFQAFNLVKSDEVADIMRKHGLPEHFIKESLFAAQPLQIVLYLDHNDWLVAREVYDLAMKRMKEFLNSEFDRGAGNG